MPKVVIPPAVAAVAFVVFFAGCAALSGQPSPEQRARAAEPMLAAAGFRMMPADSQKKLDQLKNLPQLSVRYYPGKDGQFHYWMADADFCHCFYIGDEKAYQQYQDLRLQQQLAEEQNAEMQTQAIQQQQMMMGPFGGFGYGGPGFGFGGPGAGFGRPGFGFGGPSFFP